MTEQLTHIEGLDEFTDHDLSMENDTPPDAIIVWFDVQKEYMPFLSAQAGERVYKNFVRRYFIKELGFSTGSRRIKDEVEFNEETGRWKIKRLAPAGQSDIKKFPNEWNKFYSGNTSVVSGTPIDMLFKHDPSRADMYRRNHVDSVERLAGLTEADCQRGGMGWLDDKKRAMTFLSKAKDAAGGIQNLARMQEMEAKNAVLEATIKDLTSKLDMVLTQRIESHQAASEPVSKTRRRGPKKESAEGIQGMEE